MTVVSEKRGEVRGLPRPAASVSLAVLPGLGIVVLTSNILRQAGRAGVAFAASELLCASSTLFSPRTKKTSG
jgi:hypothetical protein